ncbi:unnamed protein product [Rotaria magnacalcarata]|uniref:FLYWCH-type domain-containing protein n=4 Tax=Rotaria magnacalcarata TaxID=392030 RepID=A0A814K8I4_9BILA|nr:unnamed protein product [Rotaria magnacalcarata]
MISNSTPEKCSLNNLQCEITFSISNKGKRLLIFKNYVFRCNKTTKSKIYWMCSESECGVYIHINTTDELICINGNHNHSANPDQLETKLLRDKMKERILSETTSITKIYDEEIAKANLSKGAAAILPTVIEYRSNMSKARRKNTPVIPSGVVCDIPEFYEQTLSCQRFLFMDLFMKRGQDRILVFSSDQQLQLLFDSEIIFMNRLPVAFCLLPNKRGKTYFELFERLKEQVSPMGKQFKPKRIITDFEPGLMPVH